MKSLSKALLVCVSLCASSASLATIDTGLVSQIYVSGTQIAVQLSGGFQNANAAAECSGNNGWAGLLTAADPAMKAALFAARASGQTITVAVSGCEPGSSWLKLVGIYW